MTSQEHVHLLLIRGAISSLPVDAIARIEDSARKIRELIAADKEAGTMALALVGAEIAAEEA